jgi:hypothetical protein
VLFAIAFIAWGLIQNNIVLNYFKRINHINTKDASFTLPIDYINFEHWMIQAIAALIIIATIVLALSRQKIEDEWIKHKRLISYKIAFFSVPISTVLFLKLDPSYLVLSNLLLVTLVQIVSFQFLIKLQPRFIRSFDEK